MMRTLTLLLGLILLLTACRQVGTPDASPPIVTAIPTRDPNELPPERATFIANAHATWGAQATVLALTPVTPPPLPPPFTPHPVHLPLGIDNHITHDGPKPCGDYAENLWIGQAEDKYILVYAGGNIGPYGGGFLAVELQNIADGDSAGQNCYNPPIAVGKLHIIAADGPRLTVQAVSGEQFIFDVGTRQWVNP